jgi:NAD(P)-dependent dehydrogenase (short-subunit alcohol dehydrogenase family)
MGLIEAHAALNGKVAVVVGGGGGHIGRAVTLGLAEAGVRLIVCDNDIADMAETVAAVKVAGGTIDAFEADVTDAAAFGRFWDRVGELTDHVDILINVPGGVRRALFEETSPADHARDIRLNYGYVVESCQRALPFLRASGRGASVVNFTTIEAHRGAATYAVYAGAKAATTNFSRALAVELGADQIRVNCIAPDTTLARASNSALRDEDFARLSELGDDALAKAIGFYVPQKKPPEIADIVNGVLFLVSDLSKAITGTTLHIDGGTIAALGFLDWPEGDSFMPAPLGGTLKKLFG